MWRMIALGEVNDPLSDARHLVVSLRVFSEPLRPSLYKIFQRDTKVFENSLKVYALRAIDIAGCYPRTKANLWQHLVYIDAPVCVLTLGCILHMSTTHYIQFYTCYKCIRT